MKKPLLLPLLLLLLSCGKDEVKPENTFKQSLQGAWLPDSDVNWTFYNSSYPGPTKQVLRGTTHQYTFIGDSVYVHIVGDGSGELIGSTYSVRESGGKKYLTVWNDFSNQEKTEFEVTQDSEGMEWSAFYNRELYYTISGDNIRTDSSRVVMRWRKQE